MDLKQNTIIESIGVYLPPQSFSTSEVLTGCRNKIHFPLENITGIKTRRMAGQSEFSIDLARNAIADCLAKSKYNPTDIDLLICCNISRYDGLGLISFEPNTSIKLRKYFGFTNAIVFDITNACAGMFTGIYIVDALIKTRAIRRGMVVSGEYITHLTQTAQKEIESFMDTRLACLTLGDAGAALILEKASENQIGFQELELQTFGRYSQYCIAKASEQGGMIMYTDSVNLTDVAVKSGAKHAMNVLQRAGWPPKSFQHLIMHQTSSMTLNSARREINRLLKGEICHDGNTINNLEQRGNTASTAHFIAIADHIRNNNINTGDKIVFSISASGLTIGTALYVFDDLPDRLRQMESQQSGKLKETPIKRLSSAADPNAPRIRIESVGTIPTETIGKKNSMELLNRAATSCLKKSSYECSEIGLLIYSGVYRSEYLLEPAYAALLAGELDMNATTLGPDNKKTLAFDIFNSSVGFLNACYVAQQMIAAENCKTAMIVAAESENNADSFPDKLVGIRETASALILDSHPSNDKGFSRFLFSYDWESLNAYTTYCKTGDTNNKTGDTKPCLHVVKDTNLEALYIECIFPAVQKLLQMEGLDLNRIDKVFPPQISSSFITRLIEKLNLPRERFIDVVGEGPDLFSSSLTYAFEHAYEKGLVKPGDIGLMIAVGSGIQVGCAIYYF
ncbi:MAG: 3-oxoacyl-[acyl-carrier-protein] synthase III C-terminal domain-containing protein [Cyclobacteriaceae bacterium]